MTKQIAWFKSRTKIFLKKYAQNSLNFIESYISSRGNKSPLDYSHWSEVGFKLISYMLVHVFRWEMLWQ